MSFNALPFSSLAILLLMSGASLPAAQDAPAEDTYEFFDLNCKSCHTIGGGRITGPDLKGVIERQDKAWLVNFIQDPQGVIDSGDPYAAQLVADARGQLMTPISGLTSEIAGKLVDMITFESALEESRFVGLQLSDRALTPKDVENGRAYFLGQTDFLKGAPACASCHTVNGLGGFGGGQLGPDLTAVFARLEGRQSLGTWLSAPASEVMRPVFKDHSLDSEEILSLVAFLKDAAESGEQEATGTTLEFALSGIGLAAALMVLADILWRSRFRAVRRPLVARN